MEKHERISPASGPLDFWSECVGILANVETNEKEALAHFKQDHTIVVPVEIGKELERVLGRRIAVLRTDMPDKPYVWREVD